MKGCLYGRPLYLKGEVNEKLIQIMTIKETLKLQAAVSYQVFLPAQPVTCHLSHWYPYVILSMWSETREMGFYYVATMWPPAVTASRFPQISFSTFDQNEHNACSCSISSDSSCVAICKVTVLILNDTSRSVTDTALNLQSKTVAILPSFTVCYKKYEEWYTLTQNMQIKLQPCPFCYFCMIQAWKPFHEETYFN
jgi:hypothetical protein